MRDQQIIDQLKNGDEQVLAILYTKFRDEFFSWIINKYKCDVEDAKDYFQFAVIKFYENVMSGKLTDLTSSIKTYLFAIGKNKVLESTKVAYRFVDESSDLQEEETFNESRDKEKRLLTIEKCLAKLGEPCESLLKQFYYHKKSMDDIATRFNYSNRNTAKNLKFKCLQRLRKLVQEEYKNAA